jgi:hypothetical protein
MHAHDPLPEIVNLAEAEQAAGMPLRTPDALRQAGYRLVKARDSERHFLARPDDLQPLLVRLGDIAEVRRGFTTGANEFFYLEPVGTTVAELFRAGAQQPSQPTVRVRNSAGWQGELETAWLRPVIKSLREVRSLRASVEDARFLLFVPPNDVRENFDNSSYVKRHYPKAYAYIVFGEKTGYHLRSSCAGRQCWWDIGGRPISNAFYSIMNGERHLIAHNNYFYVSDNLGEIHLNLSKVDREFVGVLNSTLFKFFIELTGRTMTGALAVVKVQVYEFSDLLMLAPTAFTASQRDRLLEAFERMASREVRSIFEELGYPKPNREYSNIDPYALTLAQVQRASPDRFELDAVVFEVLGLSDAERLTVYRAVVELVRNRLVKARSV